VPTSAWTACGKCARRRPGQAGGRLIVLTGWVLAGNAVELHGDRLPAGKRIAVLPTARALLRLARRWPPAVRGCPGPCLSFAIKWRKPGRRAADRARKMLAGRPWGDPHERHLQEPPASSP
jgi:hypothetical protein